MTATSARPGSGSSPHDRGQDRDIAGSNRGLDADPDRPGTGEGRTDGRSARAQRTRDAIVDACIALVEQGDVRPTAPKVAEQAGVSVRSVFQHFADLPALHTAVVDRVVERTSSLFVPVDPDRPLDERIETFVYHRSALLEAVTPYRRAANVHAPFAPEIRESIRAGTRYLNDEVVRTFAPELSALPETEREPVLHALVTAVSWPAWDSLRVESGCHADLARTVMARTLRALLGA